MITGDTPIIINGGSVHLEFDLDTFPGESGRHGNDQRKIVGVEVTDNNTGQTQTIPVPANGKCTIKIKHSSKEG
jgi:hypothetical protein